MNLRGDNFYFLLILLASDVKGSLHVDLDKSCKRDISQETEQTFCSADSQDCTKGVREVMAGYWEEHSSEASVEEMMLDSNAKEITKLELPEILSYLPAWSDKEILELGAGIGRFTGELAKTAGKVIAVDFMEKFLKKNKENNSKLTNIDYKCSDVTALDIQTDSIDLVFSNWLMMYLEDEEVQNLVKKELAWLKEGGYIFARESCYKQSGDKKRTDNPTKYRDPSLYMAMFTMITIPTENEGEVFGFELVMSRPVRSYIEMKQNQNQVVWLLQKSRRKAEGSNNGFKTFQDFLDNQQYSKNGILRYEKIFGHTFVSTGGLDTTKEFVARLDLKPGQVILDVGCGIGGSAFYMVKEFGVKVIAIDLSANMINIGVERATELNVSHEDVEFEIADATKREYKPESFDVIYSRDTILHIPDKLALFKAFYKWLKKGGKLLISDYCCSEGEHTEHFKEYVKQRGYNLLSPARYGKVLEEAGFGKVKADDRTDLFVESLQKEVTLIEGMKEDYVKEFSQEDYDYIVNGWKAKLKRTDNQRWGVFYAEKL